MSRWVIALGVAAVLALSGAAPGEDPDPIKARLDKARAAYEDELTAAEKAAADALDRAEAAARKRGDKATLDKAKAERELFELAGVVPKSVSGVTQKAVAARKALDATYAAAVKEYTKAGRDAEAAAAEKGRAELKHAGGLRPRYFLVVNKNSELVLAAAKEGGEQGSGVVQAKRTDADNQLWALVPAGTADVFLLRNRASGLYASVGGGRNPGDNLVLDKDTGNTNRWVVEREGFQFVFLNAHSKLCAAVAGGSKEAGERVLQWQKGEKADEQRWNLAPAKPK
jgi:hypothetical protein